MGEVIRAEIVGAGKPLRVTKIPRPPLQPGYVRIKVAFAGVCHSDIHFIDDKDSSHRHALGDQFEGLVPGHEISGYIEEIGQDVDAASVNLSLGDAVVVCPWLGCCQCSTCDVGHNNECENNPAGTRDIGQNPDKPGGYQSHINVDPRFLVKLDQSLPLDVACMLPCSAATTYKALSKLDQAIRVGADTNGKARLLVIGAGGLGLWAISLAKVMYPDLLDITVADLDRNKLALALEYGADATVTMTREMTPQDSVQLVTKQEKFNAVLDIVGSQITSEIAVYSLHSGGAMVEIGLFGGTFSCPMGVIIGRSLTVMGSRTSNLDDLRKVVELVTANGIGYANIQHFSIDEINNALQLLKEGKVQGRAIIKYD